MTRTLVVRLDNAGDLLLAGPAIRAVAAGSTHVTLLAGPRGSAVAPLLPGLDRVVEWCSPWIDPEPPQVTEPAMADTVARLRALGVDRALVLTSFHQSPLPTALLLRMAGVPWIGAISEDYPGSLLDLRHHVGDGVPEPERALSLASAAGFALPAGDDGLLGVRRPLPPVDDLVPDEPYVVVHPGTSVTARAWAPSNHAATVRELARRDRRVVVTGAPSERSLTSAVAGTAATDLGGRTSWAQLAAVLERADVVVAGNTGPAHLAAAVGTPVVSLFAPTVSSSAWAPYGVPVELLGDQWAPCRDSRVTTCPYAGHPCLGVVTPPDVLAATDRLAPQRAGVLTGKEHP